MKDSNCDAETLIRKARNELLMLLPFYAHILFNMKLREEPAENLPYPTAAVDAFGNMVYCKEFIESLNQGKLMFVLAHEASHVGLMHCTRLRNRNVPLWNIATDLEINYMLLQENRLIPPDQGLFPKEGTYKLPSGKIIEVKDKTSEEIYEQLKDALSGKSSSNKDKEWADSYSPPPPMIVIVHNNENSSKENNDNQSNDDNQDSSKSKGDSSKGNNGNQSNDDNQDSSNSKDGSSGNNQSNDNQDSSESKDGSSDNNNNQSNDDNQDSSKSKDGSSGNNNNQSSQKSKNDGKNNSKNKENNSNTNNGKSNGNSGPKGFDAHVYGNQLGGQKASAIDPTQYDNVEDFWKEKLISAKNITKARGIGVSDCLRKKLDLILEPPQIDWRHKIRIFITQGIPTDFTMKSPGRRGRAMNLYLPTTIREHVKFVVGFDCSGSIGEDELMSFISECYHMTKFFPCCELIIVPWNGDVMEKFIVEIKQEPSQDMLNQLTQLPSGGTTLQSFIDWVDKHCNNMDNVIIFTDGYVEDKKFTLQRGQSALVVISGSGNDYILKQSFECIKLEDKHGKRRY